MTVAEQCFLAVAEEKSISRAAEKLLLSQQNLSGILHRLEEKYGTLFIRRPFRLTPTGEALLDTLLQVRVLENSLEQRLNQLNGGGGTLRAGMNVTRARVLIPSLLARFKKHFPDTEVQLVFEDTEVCEQMMRAGELDLFLGIDAARLSGFKYLHLYNEPVYYAARKSLLKKAGVLPRSDRISPCQLVCLPCLINPPVSHLRQKTDSWLRGQGVALEKTVPVPDFDLQLLLAGQEQGGCFIPEMLLPRLRQINESLPESDRLLALRPEGPELYTELSLVTHENGWKSAALQGFTQALRECFNMM